MSDRVTRQKIRERREREKAIAAMVEEMANLLDAEEDTPAWAKLLLRETMSIKSDIAQRFEQLENKFETMEKSIQSLTKENKATVNRVSNAEKRINALEEESNTVTP
ncbi:hypothetical protein ABVT39_011272 [Epinephelus coioides]